MTYKVAPVSCERSIWHEELDLILSELDDAPLQCNGVSFAVSAALNRAGILHRIYLGHVQDKNTRSIVTPHLWVALDDGWVIDYRLRMWLGDEDSVPHGVFHPCSLIAKGLFYRTQRAATLGGLCYDTLDCMTDGRLRKIFLPREFAQQNPYAWAH